MFVHEAVWKFAETDGNRYAKLQASSRKLLTGAPLKIADSKWLVGRGGTRLREAWLSLPVETRRDMMAATDDPDFPPCDSGIVDERHINSSRKTQITTTTHESRKRASQSPKINSDGTSSYMHKKYRFLKARARYFEVASKEEIVRLSIAYDSGSLKGVLDAAIKSAEYAVMLSKYKDRATTADEAYVAVAESLSDVFSSISGITCFDPEPNTDGPSDNFAVSRISAAYVKYQEAAQDAQDEMTKTSTTEDLDKPILTGTVRFFGKAHGMEIS